MYVYVGNDPVNYIDMDGRGAKLLACSAISAGVAGYLGATGNIPGAAIAGAVCVVCTLADFSETLDDNKKPVEEFQQEIKKREKEEGLDKIQERRPRRQE